jgi:hypothetical protein
LTNKGTKEFVANQVKQSKEHSLHKMTQMAHNSEVNAIDNAFQANNTEKNVPSSHETTIENKASNTSEHNQIVSIDSYKFSKNKTSLNNIK